MPHPPGKLIDLTDRKARRATKTAPAPADPQIVTTLQSIRPAVIDLWPWLRDPPPRAIE